MRVLATRRYSGPAFDELHDVLVRPLSEIAEPLPGVEAMIVSNETVDAALLDRLPDLRLVANYGVGYDRVDLAECTRRGVVVTNTPGVLDAATAELAFGLLLATQRRIVEGDRVVRRQEWAGGWADGALAPQVSGTTLGLVGLGRIGTAMANRARGFELRVLYTKRERLPPERERELAVEWRPLDELLVEADALSLHVPRTAATEGLIDARRLALLRDGACLVNTARGEIVDETALVRELVSGRLRAGLDVFAYEPHVPVELLELPNVVLTPHIGSATDEARSAMTRLVVDNVLAVAAGATPVTPVG